jgi:uncharacterized protein involved in response to NO
MNAPAALRRRLEYAGPALFSYGFRPFFLGAAAWAALAIALWLPQCFGHLKLPTAFGPLDWHIHEMIYGYVAAAVAGFLLTAIPNWTGRLPVNGYPLAALFALWLLGRIAIAGSAICGVLLAAVVDVSFLLVFAAVAFGEIVAGRNWRNLRVLIVLGVLIAGNIVFHAEVIRSGSADYGIRIGIGALIGLIMLVGGRIVPSFTHNWLVRNNPGRLPQPFSRFDGATIGASALALVCWIALPQFIVSGILLIIAGLLQTVRHVRWAGDRTLADRLVLVLHVAYAFVPLGFLLVGAAVLWPAIFPTSAGLHAWMAGAVGLMTLAVMTRASLGHTGQELVASLPTQIDLSLRIHRRAGPHHRGIRAVARASSHRRGGLDPRLRRFCRLFWSPVDGAAAGMERKNLGAEVFRVTRPIPKIADKGLRRPVDFNSIEFRVCGATFDVSRRARQSMPL